MAARSDLSEFCLLLATATSMLAFGCVHGDRSTDGAGVGRLSSAAQESVESALRRHPDPSALPEAAIAFAEACHAGQAASCSVVGVMHELGLAVPLDTQRARELYGIACEAHNSRGCENLDALIASDTVSFDSSPMATLQR